MFPRFYVPQVLCSPLPPQKGSMFPRFYVPHPTPQKKVLCSPLNQIKVLCSPLTKNAGNGGHKPKMQVMVGPGNGGPWAISLGYILFIRGMINISHHLQFPGALFIKQIRSVLHTKVNRPTIIQAERHLHPFSTIIT